MTTKRTLLGLFASAMLAAVLWTASAGAGTGDSGNELAGTWTVTVNRPAPLPPLQSLQVFTSDGSLYETANEAPASRTIQVGSWERVGGRLYAATAMFFRFNPATGAHVATQKINKNIRLSDDGQSFTQAVESTTYDLNGNVIATVHVSNQGQRLPVERIADEP